MQGRAACAVAECVLPPPPPEGNAPQGRPLGQTAISGAVTIGGRVSGESCLAGTRSFFIARQATELPVSSFFGTISAAVQHGGCEHKIHSVRRCEGENS